MRQAPRSPLSFKLQRVANVPEHPPPSTRLMSCAHIANRQLSRIIGARTASRGVGIDFAGAERSSVPNAPSAQKLTSQVARRRHVLAAGGACIFVFTSNV